MKEKCNTRFLGILLITISFAVLLMPRFCGNNFVYRPLAITILLIASILFQYNDVSNNVVFVIFHGTFFLFLIAGPLFVSLEGENFFSSFSETIISKTYFCYWLSAFSMCCFSLFSAYNHRRIVICLGKKRKKSRNIQKKTSKNIEQIRFWSRILFYISILAYTAVIINKVIFRQSFSLQEYYASYGAVSNLPGIVNKLADCHLVALALFLATKPTKMQARVPMVIFTCVSALTILYGVRNVVILNILFLIIYCSLRNSSENEIWISRRTVIIGLVSSPVVLILLQAFDEFRRNIAFNIFDIKELFSFSLLKDFFISQSVSSYILPNAIQLLDCLGDQPVLYTFGTLYTYLRQNMIVRFFTGASAFSANSIENAMSGGSLGARLAYYLYRDSFLSGTGMGGCFVADLYVDFSYIGIVIGTLIACTIIKRLTKAARKDNTSPFLLGFTLVAIRWIAYMPRDSYFSWAMQAFSFMNILFVIMIIFLSKIKVKF